MGYYNSKGSNSDLDKGKRMTKNEIVVQTVPIADSEGKLIYKREGLYIFKFKIDFNKDNKFKVRLEIIFNCEVEIINVPQGIGGNKTREIILNNVSELYEDKEHYKGLTILCNSTNLRVEKKSAKFFI